MRTANKRLVGDWFSAGKKYFTSFSRLFEAMQFLSFSLLYCELKQCFDKKEINLTTANQQH